MLDPHVGILTSPSVDYMLDPHIGILVAPQDDYIVDPYVGILTDPRGYTSWILTLESLSPLKTIKCWILT